MMMGSAARLVSGLALVLVLPVPGWPATIRGRVVAEIPDRAGEPAQVRVEAVPVEPTFDWASGVLEGRAAAPAEAATSAGPSGRFSVEAPGSGVWSIEVSGDGLVPMRLAPLAAVEAVELAPVHMVRDIGAEIEVRDPAGAPVAGAWVMAVCADRSWWHRVAADGWRVGARLDRTDSAGRLRLPMAEGEPLEVHAFGPGGVEARVVVEAGVARLVLCSGTTATRVVEVVEPGGEPADGVVVVAGDLTWPAGRTGDDGRLGIDAGSGSSMRLMLLVADGRRLSTDVEPGDGPVRLALPQLEHVRGTVLSARDRRPLARALVVPAHDPGGFVLTGGDGSFELPRPSGGRLPLRIRAARHLPGRVVIERGEQGRRLSLPLASAARGSVVDERGVPLAGVGLAVVDPRGREPMPVAVGDHAHCRAVSDQAGRFRLGGLDPGRALELQARAAGFAAAAVRLGGLEPGLERAGLRVVLERSRTAHGRIVDTGRRPVPGAELWLTEEAGGTGSDAPSVAGVRPGRDAPDATSDAEGRFSVGLVPGRAMSIHVKAAGLAPLLVRGVRVDRGHGDRGDEPVDLGTLVLAPGGAIEGIVTVGGEPAAGAGVWLDPSLEPPSPSREQALQESPPDAVVDERGRFRVDDLEQGRGLNLLVAREGLLPGWMLGVEAGSGRAVEVELQAAASVSGRVVTEDGSGVAGARVDLRAAAPPGGTLDADLLVPGLSGSASTDDRGRFTIAGLGAGAAVVEAGAAGYRPSEPERVEVGAGAAVDGLELVLGHGATLEGRVDDSDGRPIEGVRLSVGRVSTRTDADGRYRLQGLAEGAQSVALEHASFGRQLYDVDVRPPVSTRDFTLAGGLPVEGRVVDPAGYPVEGAEIVLRSAGPQTPAIYRAVAGPGGRFSIAGVAAATYDVEAGASGYATTVRRSGLRVRGAPVRDLELVLEPGTVLDGQLLGLDPDEVARVTVDATGEAGQVRRAVVGAGGSYEIDGLGPGDWLVRARLPGGAREAEARVAVQHGQRRLSRDLDLSGGLVLTGTVLHDGQPLPGTRVTLEGRDVATRRSTITDHAGELRLEGLPPGRYRVDLLNRERLITDSRELDLSRDEDIVIEIETVELLGVVLDAGTRDPVAGARVSLYHLLQGEDAPRSLTSVVTGTSGRFEISRLTAGAYRLAVQAEDHALHEERLQLQAYGAPAPMEILLERSEGLWLAVRLASGGRPALVRVSLLDTAGVQAVMLDRAQVRSDGLAHLPSVPPGTWPLLVSGPGTAPVRAVATVPGPPTEVVLEPGAALEVRVPELAEQSLVGTLTLLDTSGQRFLGLDGVGQPCTSWPAPGGTAVIEGVPPGTWAVHVSVPDGRAWQGRVTTSGIAAELVLGP
jgi:protocatechuate 3,4-dioxygenase beta subunit